MPPGSVISVHWEQKYPEIEIQIIYKSWSVFTCSWWKNQIPEPTANSTDRNSKTPDGMIIRTGGASTLFSLLRSLTCWVTGLPCSGVETENQDHLCHSQHPPPPHHHRIISHLWKSNQYFIFCTSNSVGIQQSSYSAKDWALLRTCQLEWKCWLVDISTGYSSNWLRVSDLVSAL